MTRMSYGFVKKDEGRRVIGDDFIRLKLAEDLVAFAEECPKPTGTLFYHGYKIVAAVLINDGRRYKIGPRSPLMAQMRRRRPDLLAHLVPFLLNKDGSPYPLPAVSLREERKLA